MIRGREHEGRYAPMPSTALERWWHGRVRLIGDAAQATSPITEGAGGALEDAVVHSDRPLATRRVRRFVGQRIVPAHCRPCPVAPWHAPSIEAPAAFLHASHRARRAPHQRNRRTVP